MDPVAVALGVTSALSWGAGDFAGGIASRRIGSLVTATAGDLLGVIVLVGFVAASAEWPPSVPEVGWAAIAGTCGTLGLVSFYRALARGDMGLVAALAGALGAAIPVGVSVALGESIGVTQMAGVLCGLAAIVAVSLDARRADDRRLDLRLVLAAGIGFAVFFLAIDRATAVSHHTWTPLLISRSSGVTMLFAIFAARRQSPFSGISRNLAIVAAVGLGDLGGNLFFVLASARAPLSVAVVLSSLYPVTTAALAWLWLGERLRPIQVAGAVLAVAAIVLIAM